MISKIGILTVLLFATVRCTAGDTNKGNEIPSLIPKDKDESTFEVRSPIQNFNVRLSFERKSENEFILTSKVWDANRCQVKNWRMTGIGGQLQVPNWSGTPPHGIIARSYITECSGTEEQPQTVLNVSHSWNPEFDSILETEISPVKKIGKDNIAVIAGGSNLFPIISLEDGEVTGWMTAVNVQEDNVELPKNNLWENAVEWTKSDCKLIQYNKQLIALLDNAVVEGHIQAKTKFKQNTTQENIRDEQKAIALPDLADLNNKENALCARF